MSAEIVKIAASALSAIVIIGGFFVYVDRLYSHITRLEEQIQSLEAPVAAMTPIINRFNESIVTLNNRVTSLEASSAATASILKEANGRPVVATNPILEKCVKLADEASTGERGSGFGFASGPEVIKNALAAMEKLGCSSTVH